MQAAENSKRKVIGVDIDQSKDSETVITSAMKSLGTAVQTVLADYYAGDFPGGETLILGAPQFGVQIPMETSKFEVFNQDDYDSIYSDLVAGNIKIKKDNVKSVADLGLSAVNVNIIE